MELAIEETANTTYTGKEVEELIGNKDICINVFPEKEKE